MRLLCSIERCWTFSLLNLSAPQLARHPAFLISLLLSGSSPCADFYSSAISVNFSFPQNSSYIYKEEQRFWSQSNMQSYFCSTHYEHMWSLYSLPVLLKQPTSSSRGVGLALAYGSNRIQWNFLLPLSHDPCTLGFSLSDFFFFFPIIQSNALCFFWVLTYCGCVALTSSFSWMNPNYNSGPTRHWGYFLSNIFPDTFKSRLGHLLQMPNAPIVMMTM